MGHFRKATVLVRRAIFIGIVLLIQQIQSVSSLQSSENISYEYDDLGRLTKVSYADSSVVYSFAYDASGNRKSHNVTSDGPKIRLWNTRILEGGGLYFGVWITQPGLAGVSVDWEVYSGPGVHLASAPEDFTLSSGTVSFPTGAQEVSIHIPTVDDSIIEHPELVHVRLTSSTGAPIDSSNSTAVGTIRDNDGVYFNVGDTTVAEGGLATLTVARQGPTGTPIDVAVSTVGREASSGLDFDPIVLGANNQPLPNGTLSFGTNETSKTLLVQTTADTMYEPEEYFSVDLSWSNGGIAGWERADIAIPNDDPIPEINISNSGNREGQPVGFTVWLSNPTYLPVDVTYNVTDSGSNAEGYPNATLISDFTVAGSYVTGSINSVDVQGSNITHTIEPGVDGLTVWVPTVDDQAIENAGGSNFEAFYIQIANATNATINSNNQAKRGRIRDDDQSVTMTASAPSVDEGNGTANTITIPVTLSAPGFGDPTTVDWAVTGGSAVHGVDFSGPTTGTAEIAFGETTSNDIQFSTVPNTQFTSDKTIQVTFSNWQHASYVGGTVLTATILEDDAQSVNFAASSSGNQSEDVIDRTFTVTRSGNTSTPASVYYVVGNAGAVLNEDYQAKAGYPLSGTLSFAANETSKSVLIEVIDDDVWEQLEHVQLSLSSPSSGAVLLNSTTTVGIGNNDGTPIINIFNNGGAEGNSTNSLPMTIFLQGGTTQPVTVTYRTSDGTATAGQDYTAIPDTTVTIQPGSFEHNFNVTILGDTTIEPDETFNVEVVSVINGRTVTTGINAQEPNKGSNGVGTIANDDVADTPTYSYGAWGGWQGACGGTQNRYRTVTCTMSPSGASCGTSTQSDSRVCNVQTFSYSSWSGWQGACGGTQTRTRTRTCTWSPSGTSCGTTTETDTRTCNVKTYSNGPVSWGACSSSGTRTGTYTRTCTWSPSGSSCGTSTHSTSGTCTPSYTYSWSTGSWSQWQCSGVGYLAERSRSATCVRSDGTSVSGSFCGSSPSTYQTQNNPTLCGGGIF